MYNRSGEQLIIIQAEMEYNKQEMKPKKQESNEKIMKLTE